MPTDAGILQHELAVHQEELRAQNEKLVASMATLEEARDRYIELYDFAPNGYMTLDVRGLMREINLGAASLLGVERESLIGLPLLRYVGQAGRPAFLRYLGQCRRLTGDGCQVIEVPLNTAAGPRTVQLTCRPRAGDPSHGEVLFVTLVDVTEQRRLEADREALRRRHAELVRQTLSAAERERQRIARDVHDELGQQVSGLRLKLDWLASLVADNPQLRGPVATVQAAAAGVDRHVDYLLRELRPAGLDVFGLVGALEQAVREWGATFGVAAHFSSSGGDGDRLPSEAEAHVYRMLQEALNNVHKHAAARRVDVRLDRRAKETVLTVADDGVGFDPATPHREGRRGLGLLGMRERATLIGAELHVTSRPGRGTTIVIAIR
jgi:signal transduction histidine kinase